MGGLGDTEGAEEKGAWPHGHRYFVDRVGAGGAGGGAPWKRRRSLQAGALLAGFLEEAVSPRLGSGVVSRAWDL